MRFEKHVFICTNQRATSERKSCGEAHGLELVKMFKKLVKDKGLNTSIRAQKTGCLDACEFGPTLVVYPEGVFYGSIEFSDVEEIVNEHLANNRPVERLIIDFSAKAGS
ncbi:MAG: (2Fe-2S) ferredoxin domain-containing protein [Bacteroidota bacterium]|nr:(2Fe-2S) ferredoxin domain-containing protein [Bacteroidota bacterium]